MPNIPFLKCHEFDKSANEDMIFRLIIVGYLKYKIQQSDSFVIRTVCVFSFRYLRIRQKSTKPPNVLVWGCDYVSEDN